MATNLCADTQASEVARDNFNGAGDMDSDFKGSKECLKLEIPEGQEKGLFDVSTPPLSSSLPKLNALFAK